MLTEESSPEDVEPDTLIRQVEVLADAGDSDDGDDTSGDTDHGGGGTSADSDDNGDSKYKPMRKLTLPARPKWLTDLDSSHYKLLSNVEGASSHR
jgi:hypothetical protein